MIAIREVSKRFGSIEALRSVSLDIGRGERVGFVGSNGSGKTTLLRAMLGLIRVRGQVTIEGIDVGRSPERALSRVAYIPQIAPPLDAPVSEVVRASATLRGIDPLAVFDKATKLGLPLSTCATTRFNHLSGGMRQKVLAALALAAAPRILICDEPTANLDARARAGFLAEMQELDPACVVVICSHRSDEIAALVERVIELREGRVERDLRSKPTTGTPVLYSQVVS